jgi:hypothetical protein
LVHALPSAGVNLRQELPMKVPRISMVLGWVLGFAPVAALAVDPAWQARSELARELIAVTKVDEQAVQKVEKLILARCQVEECDADLRECLMKIDKDYFTRFLEVDFRNELTVEETRQAIAYFRTETGLKHLDILRAEQGLGGSDTLFNQSAGTRAGILAFLDTRVGYLLITRSVLTNSASQWIGGKAREAFWRCRPEK